MNKDAKDGKSEQHAALRAQVEQLRNEASVSRKKVSECVKDLMAYCDQHKQEDFLVAGPAAGAENPFQEKKKCGLL